MCMRHDKYISLSDLEDHHLVEQESSVYRLGHENAREKPCAKVAVHSHILNAQGLEQIKTGNSIIVREAESGLLR